MLGKFTIGSGQGELGRQECCNECGVKEIMVALKCLLSCHFLLIVHSQNVCRHVIAFIFQYVRLRGFMDASVGIKDGASRPGGLGRKAESCRGLGVVARLTVMPGLFANKLATSSSVVLLR